MSRRVSGRKPLWLSSLRNPENDLVEYQVAAVGEDEAIVLDRTQAVPRKFLQERHFTPGGRYREPLRTFANASMSRSSSSASGATNLVFSHAKKIAFGREISVDRSRIAGKRRPFSSEWAAGPTPT